MDTSSTSTAADGGVDRAGSDATSATGRGQRSAAAAASLTWSSAIWRYGLACRQPIWWYSLPACTSSTSAQAASASAQAAPAAPFVRASESHRSGRSRVASLMSGVDSDDGEVPVAFSSSLILCDSSQAARGKSDRSLRVYS